MVQSSIQTLLAVVMLTPLRPLFTRPLMLRLRSTTLPPDAAILMPLVPDTSTEPKISWQSIVIDLVMVTAPKPPGSRQLISPPAAVLEMAPGNVLHGAVRLHGLASSPTPETQVRVAWALAGADASKGATSATSVANNAMRRMVYLLC